MSHPEEQVNWKAYWDDVTGKPLDQKGVMSAQEEEMKEFKKHGVYKKVSIHEAWRVTGKAPIGVRWVDINKGDEINPEYRSRLVAKEIKKYADLDLFAATPPWEAEKLLFSMAVTRGIGWSCSKEKGHMIAFIDVRRAYFHARSRRTVYVQLPAEDFKEGHCGKLDKSMYGTRDAAQNWEFEYTEFMQNAGFSAGKSVTCLFHHVDRDLRAAVHGDDFTVLGPEDQLNWFRTKVTERFEVKFRGTMGPGHKDQKSIRLLNRVFEWSSEGIKVEGEARRTDPS